MSLLLVRFLELLVEECRDKDAGSDEKLALEALEWLVPGRLPLHVIIDAGDADTMLCMLAIPLALALVLAIVGAKRLLVTVPPQGSGLALNNLMRRSFALAAASSLARFAALSAARRDPCIMEGSNTQVVLDLVVG